MKADKRSYITSSDYDINHVYKDLNLSLEPHPLTGNYKPTQGIEAVKKSVKHLVQSSKWDYPFNPIIYGGVEELLFETLNPVLVTHIQTRIEDILKQYEPRIRVITLQLRQIDQSLVINLVYEVIAVEQVIEATITLKRER